MNTGSGKVTVTTASSRTMIAIDGLDAIPSAAGSGYSLNDVLIVGTFCKGVQNIAN